MTIGNMFFGQMSLNLIYSDLMEKLSCGDLRWRSMILSALCHGGSVVVWGCFSRSGVGNLCFIEGNMDRFLYREILGKNLLQSCQKLGLENSFVFQHDNDPKHTAGVVKDWLKQKKIETLNWPSFSLNMNPIEHLWDELERRMKKQREA